MSHAFTDIVIPVHGALDYLKECIRTLKEHTQDYRLIFVDDFSQSQDVTNFLEGVRAELPSTVIVQTHKQKWFTRASNIGLRLVQTERCILLNTDCVVGPGWLQEMYDVWDLGWELNQHKRVGLVGSTLSEGETRRFRFALHPDYATGHCWLINMQAFREIAALRGTPNTFFNELDVSQIHINSDRIMCWDLERMGFLILASHKAAVGHHGGKSWDYNLGRVSALTLSDVDG